MHRLHRNCTADLHAKPMRVYDLDGDPLPAPPEAPGPILHCQNCGCHVAVPEQPAQQEGGVEEAAIKEAVGIATVCIETEREAERIVRRLAPVLRRDLIADIDRARRLMEEDREPEAHAILEGLSGGGSDRG